MVCFSALVFHFADRRGERVALGASGGKDSTVLIHVLKTLNDRYDYGLELYLLSIDEGIRGYRDDSLATVEQNSKEYQLPLKVLPGVHELGRLGFVFLLFSRVCEREKEHAAPCFGQILSYDELYGGWTMDKVVSEVGLKSNCTFCGVFRRQALDRGALLIKGRSMSWV